MSQVRIFAALLALVTLAAPIHAQPEIDKLRADIARLRTELDALKATVAAGKASPEKGPLYRRLPAAYWLEQMKDFDVETRIDAIKAVGALATADKKLIAPLLDLLKNETHSGVLSVTASILGEIGPEALPVLIEFAKDKGNGKKRSYALEAIAHMGGRARPALPMLTAVLKETEPAVLRGAINAITSIGADAKKAVPALVDALGDTLADGGKPDMSGRFGANRTSINYMLFEAVRYLDPDLVGDLTPPRVSAGFADFPGAGGGKKGKGGAFPGGGGPGVMAKSLTPAELVSAWEKIHQTLVKRYVERK